MDFAKIAKPYLCLEGRKRHLCTLSNLAQKVCGPKQPKPGKNYKDRGFSGNVPKPKMTFFEKGVLKRVCV